MKHALLAATLLAPGAAWALLGLGATGFQVGVRDAATGRPLEGAFVVAREFATVGKFEGSDTYCVRGDVAPASGDWTAVKLPSPGSDQFTQAKAIEAFAYHPGYCIAKSVDGAAASSDRHLHIGGTAPLVPLDPSVPTKLALRRAAQGPLERLLYLREVAAGLTCGKARWSARSAEVMQRLVDAMLGEARALAHDRYEKLLVERLRGALAYASAPPAAAAGAATGFPALQPVGASFARDFIVVATNTPVLWDDRHRMAIAARSAPAARAATTNAIGAASTATPGVAIAPRPVPQPAALAIHCRHGAPSACDLDERDSTGATALFAFVRDLKLDEARLMLEAGANPDIPQRPFGPPPIEVLLERIVSTPPGSSQAQRVGEMLALLVADRRTTLPRALRDDLAADPSTWKRYSGAPGLAAIAGARERLLALPARPDAKPGCASPGYVMDWSTGPFRLR